MTTIGHAPLIVGVATQRILGHAPSEKFWISIRSSEILSGAILGQIGKPIMLIKIHSKLAMCMYKTRHQMHELHLSVFVGCYQDTRSQDLNKCQL